VGGVPRQGPDSPSVPGHPEGPALQLQHSGQLNLQQAPSSTHTHTHTHARAQAHTYQHAWKHPLSSSLAGSKIVNPLCLSCVFSSDVGTTVLLFVIACL
jgi:hypothetical protein